MKGCKAGCNHFECGSIGHHKDCQNYPNSMQQMIDLKNIQIEEMAMIIRSLVVTKQSTLRAKKYLIDNGLQGNPLR